MSPPSSTTTPADGSFFSMRLLKMMLCAGLSGCHAEAWTIPLDTAKVRLQLQGQGKAAGTPYTGMFNVLTRIPREEGFFALWKGLSPGLLRQIVFASLRIGLYEPIRNLYHRGEGPPSLSTKILAGLTTGTIGICVASPTDLVKVRMQAEGRLPPGTPRQYNNVFHAFKKIVQTEGVPALWTGLLPNIGRNAIINAAELATYDEVKQRLLASGLFQDNVACHLASGLGAGFIATVCGSPVDVVKTRVMNQKKVAAGEQPVYRGMAHAFVKILSSEGPLAFYKGFIPNYSRIGSWNVVMFLTLEQLKLLVL